jgi:hypothetical protein
VCGDQPFRPVRIGEAVFLDEGDDRCRAPCQSDSAGVRPLLDVRLGQDLDRGARRRGQRAFASQVDDDDLDLVERRLRAEAIECVLRAFPAVPGDHHHTEPRLGPHTTIVSGGVLRLGLDADGCDSPLA